MWLDLIVRIGILVFTPWTIMSLIKWDILCSATNPVCNTLECTKLSMVYQDGLNPEVDPCVDFYNYTCSGWRKQNKPPKHIRLWPLDRAMKFRALKDLRGVLERPELSNPTEEQAKKVYKACMNMPFMSILDTVAIRQILARIGPWPMFSSRDLSSSYETDWWSINNFYLRITGESALFNIFITSNVKSDNKIIILVEHPESVYGRINRFRDFSPHEYKYYMKFLEALVESIAPTDSKKYAHIVTQDLKDVIQFRQELTQAILKDPSKLVFERMKIKQFEQWYNLQENSRVNWLDQFRAVRRDESDPNGFKVKEDEVIFVQQSYFTILSQMLRNTAKRTIINHIHLYFVEKHISLNPKLKDFLQKSYTIALVPSGEMRYIPERWVLCIESNNMQKTLAKMYVKAFFPKEKKEAIKTLLERGKNIMQHQISSSTWLDSTTKRQSIVKIHNIKSMIGYPDWYDDRTKSIKDPELDIFSLTPDAAYNINKNYVYITAAYLQWPIHVLGAPYVIDYGSTLSVLGHELQHALDDLGILFDATGRTPFFPIAMIEKYHRQKKCFLDHFSVFSEREYRKFHVYKPKRIPNTLSEDIADAMGVKLAYLGYKHKLQEEKNECPVLPGFERHGCEKLFFIAYANSFCDGSKPDAQLKELLSDKHNTPAIRVNAVVANMPEFTAAFKCKQHDPLYTRSSCDLWREKDQTYL